MGMAHPDLKERMDHLMPQDTRIALPPQSAGKYMILAHGQHQQSELNVTS